MKKIVFFFLISAFTLTNCKKKESSSDDTTGPLFEVYDVTGAKVNDNHEFVFNTVDQSAQLNLMVKNLTGETLKLKTKLTSVTGTDGSMFEFCFGNCYVGMQQGTAYPVGSTLDVAANQTTSPNDIHYLNHYDGGNATYNVVIYAVDDNGNQKGDEFHFVYKYQP